jgi:hypothetical protein
MSINPTSIGKTAATIGKKLVKEVKPNNEGYQIIKQLDHPVINRVEMRKKYPILKEAFKVIDFLNTKGNELLKTLTGSTVEVKRGSALLKNCPTFTFTFKPGEKYMAAVQNFIKENSIGDSPFLSGVKNWKLDKTGNLIYEWCNRLTYNGQAEKGTVSNVKNAFKELTKILGK